MFITKDGTAVYNLANAHGIEVSEGLHGAWDVVIFYSSDEWYTLATCNTHEEAKALFAQLVDYIGRLYGVRKLVTREHAGAIE